MGLLRQRNRCAVRKLRVQSVVCIHVDPKRLVFLAHTVEVLAQLRLRSSDLRGATVAVNMLGACVLFIPAGQRHVSAQPQQGIVVIERIAIQAQTGQAAVVQDLLHDVCVLGVRADLQHAPIPHGIGYVRAGFIV